MILKHFHIAYGFNQIVELHKLKWGGSVWFNKVIAALILIIPVCRNVVAVQAVLCIGCILPLGRCTTQYIHFNR